MSKTPFMNARSRRSFTNSITLTKAIPLLLIFIVISLRFFLVSINQIKIFVITSGSMEPHIPTGSIIFVKPKKFGYKKGDIITFNLSQEASIVSHRIIAYRSQDGHIEYQTKGDANDNPDNFFVTFSMIKGHVVLVIPFIGRVLFLLQTPEGFSFCFVVPASILIYEELKYAVRIIFLGTT